MKLHNGGLTEMGAIKSVSTVALESPQTIAVAIDARNSIPAQHDMRPSAAVNLKMKMVRRPLSIPRNHSGACTSPGRTRNPLRYLH